MLCGSEVKYTMGKYFSWAKDLRQTDINPGRDLCFASAVSGRPKTSSWASWGSPWPWTQILTTWVVRCGSESKRSRSQRTQYMNPCVPMLKIWDQQSSVPQTCINRIAVGMASSTQSAVLSIRKLSIRGGLLSDSWAELVCTVQPSKELTLYLDIQNITGLREPLSCQPRTMIAGALCTSGM